MAVTEFANIFFCKFDFSNKCYVGPALHNTHTGNMFTTHHNKHSILYM